MKLIRAFVFATRIVYLLFFLNPKFQASSLFLSLHRPVCVCAVRKPHCWFSHETALMLTFICNYTYFAFNNFLCPSPLNSCKTNAYYSRKNNLHKRKQILLCTSHLQPHPPRGLGIVGKLTFLFPKPGMPRTAQDTLKSFDRSPAKSHT